MSDVETWKKYFNEVFEHAWECYSESCDVPYRQWCARGARWVVDFQSNLISKNKKLESQLATYKAVVKKQDKALCDINNVAPPMHKYSNIELEIIMVARQTRKEVAEMLKEIK